MNVVILPSHDYHRERWRNGAGWTREIVRLRGAAGNGWIPYADDDTGDDWDVRLSIAEIDTDCAFSAFPGIERELVLLHGDGIELTFADGRVVVVDPPHGRIRFAGADAPNCHLSYGPTHDFNLMWRAQRVQAQLLHRPLVGAMVFFAGAGVAWAVHLVSGRAHFKDRADLAPLQAGDSALLGAGDAQRLRVILDGGGELLLVRLALPAQT